MSEINQRPLTRCHTLGLNPSFGFGDRTGLATPGHIAAMREAGGALRAIFAQQSIREMQRTGRSPNQVMNDAMNAAALAAWDHPCGGDADHLKNEGDVRRMLCEGFTFLTLDPSDHVHPDADQLRREQLDSAYESVRELAPWEKLYANREIKLSGGEAFSLTTDDCKRASVKYGKAVQAAIRLADAAREQAKELGADYEIELSIDETAQPTTPGEHWMIANECLKAGMPLVSLAPRFVGDFEKGVDFKGDLRAFEQSLYTHAAIARSLGPYKLSLHSGSDKISIYAMFAKATRGQFHVKTAGTSYLEALRVIAQHETELFRRIVLFARDRYPTDRATYHVSGELSEIAPPETLNAEELEDVYLQQWAKTPEGKGFTQPGRQILHCTFGSVLNHPEFGPALLECLRKRADAYIEVLREHFVRHLRPLNAYVA